MSEPSCCYCATTDAELRPYGPGGDPICFPCMKASPERERQAESAMGTLIEASGAIGDPLIVGGTAEHRRQVLAVIDMNRSVPDE